MWRPVVARSVLMPPLGPRSDHSVRYGRVLRDLITTHPGSTHVYYLDVPFAETLRRHATRPQAADFTPEQMRDWFSPGDVLGVPGEHVIPDSPTLDETVDHILRTSGLPDAPAVAHCPARCPHCRERGF